LPPDIEKLEVAAGEGKRTINAFNLMMMVYFMTCGGPFGIEMYLILLLFEPNGVSPLVRKNRRVENSGTLFVSQRDS